MIKFLDLDFKITKDNMYTVHYTVHFVKAFNKILLKNKLVSFTIVKYDNKALLYVCIAQDNNPYCTIDFKFNSKDLEKRILEALNSNIEFIVKEIANKNKFLRHKRNNDEIKNLKYEISDLISSKSLLKQKKHIIGGINYHQNAINELQTQLKSIESELLKDNSEKIQKLKDRKEKELKKIRDDYDKLYEKIKGYTIWI